MKLITRQTLANEAAERYRASYQHTSYWGAPWNRENKHAELVALGDTPNPDDVDRIMGNNSWTAVPACSCCGKEGLEQLVGMQDYNDEPGATIGTVCPDCLAWALSLVPGRVAMPDEISDEQKALVRKNGSWQAVSWAVAAYPDLVEGARQQLVEPAKRKPFSWDDG